MSIYNDKWFEVWREGSEPPHIHLLVVMPDDKKSGCVVVLDPKDNYKIVHQGQNYEATCLWLGEDEFELVEGRVFPNDEWQ